MKKNKLRLFVSDILFIVLMNTANAIRVMLHYSYRFKSVDEHFRDETQINSETGSYLLACWHETLFSITLAQVGRTFCALCSRSRAGRVVAFMIRRLGFQPILGSQASGGKAARVEILEYLKKGVPAALTIDGSFGPRRFVKPGIVDLAKKGNVSIIPVYSHCDRKWVLNTWDKFCIPKPFAKITIYYGVPITVPQNENTNYEVIQNQIKSSLEEMEKRASEEVIGSVVHAPNT